MWTTAFVVCAARDMPVRNFHGCQLRGMAQAVCLRFDIDLAVSLERV
jgi:hypothetical protein